MKYYVERGDTTYVVEVGMCEGRLKVTVDDVEYPVDVTRVEEGGLISLLIGTDSHTYGARFENGTAVLSFHDREVRVKVEDERSRMARLATGAAREKSGQADVKSVMPGVVKELRVAPGDTVQEGQPLLILEAMKMENEIRSPIDGLVEAVHVAAGEAVDKGAPLMDLTAPEAEPEPSPANV